MSSSIEITPELMAGFLDEAPEYLETLDAGLMELEARAGTGVLTLETPEDIEQMTVMFRAAHSLKGLAAAFGFDKIKDLTHLMETLFDQVRMQKRDLAADSFDTLFRVFDRLKALVAELTGDGSDAVEIDDVLQALNDILATGGDEKAPAASPSGDPATASTEASEPGHDAVQGQDATDVGAADEGAAASPQVPQPASSEVLAQNEIFSDPSLASLFLETTVEAVEELGQGLLKLEENPCDSELLNTIFRCAHNVKGASGAAGLTGMNRLTHDMESVFDQMRQNQLGLDEALTNALLEGLDRIRGSLDQIRAGDIQDVDIASCHDLFTAWTGPSNAAGSAGQASLSTGAGKDVEPSPAADGDSTTDSNAADAMADGQGSAIVTITFPSDFAEAAIQAYLIHNKLGELGTVLSSDPDMDSMAGDTSLDVLKFVMETDAPHEEIAEIIRAYTVESVSVTGVDEAEPTVETVGASPATESSTAVEPVPATPPAKETKAAAGTSQSPVQPAQSAESSQGTPPPKTSPAAKAAPGEANGNRKTEQSSRRPGETLRVDLERLDDLMNLGGELIINRARFGQIHRSLKSVFDGKNLGYLVDDMTERLAHISEGIGAMEGSDGSGRCKEELANNMLHLRESFSAVRSLVERVHELRTSMYDFDEAMHSLTRVSDGIQKGIMSTRLVSIGPLFSRFRRVVRDLGKATGKQVELVLRGEQTELDKRMIDELGDPLTHMVRNSVDHGIESPEDRERAGKNPCGTVILQARHLGNNVCIEVIDDGAGINVERVKAKIIERDLATEAQVEKMSHREIIQYVLRPGFSTAEVVTDLSGRGMGMDIVVSKVEQINGTIEIDSTPGEGSKVTIKLPLTMAILTSIVARIGQGIYAIPLEAVAEIITVKRENVQAINRKRVVLIRDRVVPLSLFEDMFDTTLPALQTESRDDAEFQLVIVGFDNEQTGLIVDELLGQEDVVIKSLAENYRNVRGIAGASIRGDGTVSLILDVGAMMEMSAAMAEGTPATV